jgi:hypothetical protein
LRSISAAEGISACPSPSIPNCDLDPECCGRICVVRVFVKKTKKTPRREIDLALERAKEVNER